MRDLYQNELQYVTGAGCAPCPPSAPARGKQKKGNNGFGNGPDANRDAPGNSAGTGGGKDGSFGDERGER